MRNDWFRHAGYGMMVHWGVYSAIGRGEWVLNRERMPWEEYRAATAGLTGERFDADAWADLAVEAGQKYLIFTAKHHDGFCFWNTRTTSWNSVQQGPRRDVAAELTSAFHRRGLKVGWFFSMADWSHPDYPTPYAVDWPVEGSWASDQARRNVVEYDIAQITELVRDYETDVMWFDGAAPGMSASMWDAQRIMDLIRSHRPDCLVNNRLFLPGDFDALELHLNMPKDRLWETDYPINDGWAYNPADQNWKSPIDLFKRLLATRQAGGNLLLTINPGPDGQLEAGGAAVIRKLGRHLRRVGEGVFDLEPHALSWTQFGPITRKGNAIFLHVLYQRDDTFIFAGAANRVLSVTLLEGRRSVRLPHEQDASGRVIVRGLAKARRNELGYCLKLELDGEPRRLGAGHQNLNF